MAAPLLHGDFAHLMSNALPLAVVGTAMLYLYPDASRIVLPAIYFGPGVAVWLFARDSVHIGASGLVYGLVCYVFVAGILRRDRRAIAASLLVAFMYGALVWGVLPIRIGVSWETHLAAALIGVALALRPARARHSAAQALFVGGRGGCARRRRRRVRIRARRVRGRGRRRRAPPARGRLNAPSAGRRYRQCACRLADRRASTAATTSSTAAECMPRRAAMLCARLSTRSMSGAPAIDATFPTAMADDVAIRERVADPVRRDRWRSGAARSEARDHRPGGPRDGRGRVERPHRRERPASRGAGLRPRRVTAWRARLPRRGRRRPASACACADRSAARARR